MQPDGFFVSGIYDLIYFNKGFCVQHYPFYGSMGMRSHIISASCSAYDLFYVSNSGTRIKYLIPVIFPTGRPKLTESLF